MEEDREVVGNPSQDDFISEGSPDSEQDETLFPITVSYRGQDYEYSYHEDATIQDLFTDIEATLDIPFTNQKIMAPKTPLIKAPFKDPDMPLSQFKGKKLKVIGASAGETQSVQYMADRVARRNAARHLQRQRAKAPKPKRRLGETKYTFHDVRPLLGLPNPQRSQLLLERLKNDPGIVATMKKHKFSVNLLTEMEPLSNTQSTHEGTTRLLGLNRNQGECIELRLRTDAHDGYRDYKTIRKTLCHELAHNVHGPHDRQFWDLCHQIEREVGAADWKTRGQTIGESSHYTISGEEEDHEDEGGWTGGEFVVGGVNRVTAGMSRSEILAWAAAERQRRQELEQTPQEPDQTAEEDQQ